MKPKLSGTSVRIIVSIILLLLLCYKPVVNYFENEARVKNLSQKHAYEVYFTYVYINQDYRLYLMCNPKYPTVDIIANVFTEEYFNALTARIDADSYPSGPTTVYLMNPADEIPFGWQKSYEDIACNFDHSVFHRNTVCRVSIPYGTTNLDDCEIEYQSPYA